jgi:hypothetical protein
MSVSKARSKPAGLHGRPPEPTRADHRILMSGGTTMALELRQSRVQQQKTPCTIEKRLVGLLKENRIYRREIGFSRGCLQAYFQFVDEVYNVFQELELAYLNNLHLPHEFLEEVHRLALRLQRPIDECERIVLEREDEWVDSWQSENGYRIPRHDSKPPSMIEKRLVSLLKENGIYRRELGFSYDCFQTYFQFVDEVYNVFQELELAYLYNLHLPHEYLEEVHRPALRLQKAIHNCERIVLESEEEWVDSWQSKNGHRIPEHDNVI